jgi:5-methyltetrahydropteroyltriglutamate--homocysteine methyltransferase
MPVRASNLGFPRIGPRRELKRALEGYWQGTLSAAELQQVAARLRSANWQLQRRLGIDDIPSNDFSLYDHVLDTAVMLGAVPERFLEPDGTVSLPSYFAMARGGKLRGRSLSPLEMTKWFDTNYHYLVPELSGGQQFQANPAKVLDELNEASALGIGTRPVLLGPVSFLWLAKYNWHSGDHRLFLPSLLASYQDVLAALAGAGATWVQLDEPVLGLELPPEAASAYSDVYHQLAEAAAGLQILVATYFTGLRRNLPLALSLPVAALHLDLEAEPAQLEPALDGVPEPLCLSLGVVNGRNVWRSDLDNALRRLELAMGKIGADRLMVAPSCSLLHLPVDAAGESHVDRDVHSWLAFATQRLEEVSLLARALNEGRAAVADDLAASHAASVERSRSPKVHDAGVRARAEASRSLELGRGTREERQKAQAERLPLPILPTTTVGSFPQTGEVRSDRACWRRGDMSDEDYRAAMRSYISDAVAFQDAIGLDVIVHGEPERNDMVEYFAENLDGFAITENGWVQSYGSRCVKPPVIYGDVARPSPITVEWAQYTQSLTDRPVKGMLTGPVTMMKWSFVRDDQPLSETCRQIALAVRDEVVDLEAAGLGIIQIDEPALREGLPLHVEDWPDYLSSAVDNFRVASSGAAAHTQVHTHMCYAEFDDIMDAIVALDADVVSIEAARSGMELLKSFTSASYPNDIGPGIWDIHSPRTPTVDELDALLGKLMEIVPVDHLWVNPDCGLKTRSWEEVRPALRNMVEAAQGWRRRLQEAAC